MCIVPLELPDRSAALVVGAGGGFDFMCGLPIAIELEARGHQVHLANYSFTDLSSVRLAKEHSASLLEVTAESIGDDAYFPERDVAAWCRERRGAERSVWCLARRGLPETLESYRYLVQRMRIETVICVDGGVDGLFRGDETDLGTPSMDAVSVFATHLCGADRRIYASTVFGTEGAEGQVCHAQALERMAELVQQDAAIGVGFIRERFGRSRNRAALNLNLHTGTRRLGWHGQRRLPAQTAHAHESSRLKVGSGVGRLSRPLTQSCSGDRQSSCSSQVRVHRHWRRK
jgi:hypothetical protein